MSARAKVNNLLAQAGAVLKRKRKHEIWSLPNGQNFVRPATPSDTKSDANGLSDLKHALGIVKPAAVQGERRARKVTHGPAQPKTRYKKPENLTLAQSLRMAGLTDEALRDRMAAQETRMCELERRIVTAETHMASCWACRLSSWLRSKVG